MTQALESTPIRGQKDALRVAAGVGSGNFMFRVPVADYPGRAESPLKLSLVYNSRVWQKVPYLPDQDRIVFDIDDDWPAPGWCFSLERLISSKSVPILVGPDGTRHPAVVREEQVGPNGGKLVGQRTTDGSLITFYRERGSGVNSGYALYPDGARVVFDARSEDGGTLYPTRRIDRHGNVTRIDYRGGTGPNIERMVDPTGRTLTFQYDLTGQQLIAVKGPGCYLAPDIVLLRLHYQWLNLDTSWSPGLDVDAPAQAVVIDGVMSPPSGQGYWFGDPGDLSGYGMVRNVRKCVGMEWQPDLTDPPNPQGKMTKGIQIHLRSYNYPAASGVVLSDSPTYTQMDEGYVGGITERTTFSVKPFSVSGTESTITYGDGSSTVQRDLPAADTSGLLSNLSTFDPLHKLIQSVDTNWQPGADGAPFLTHVTTTSPISSWKVEYDPGPNNQVREERRYRPGGGLDTRTVIEYEAAPVYTDRHILNLPKRIHVSDFGGTAISLTTYAYDTVALHPVPGITGVASSYDPGSDIYDSRTAFRGCVTVERRYPIPRTGTAGIAVEVANEYDRAGNLVQQDLGPQRQTWVYDQSTEYALATRLIVGSKDPDSPARITNEAAYNPAGLMSWSRGVDGTLTDYGYTMDGFRPMSLVHLEQPFYSVTILYDDLERRENLLVRDENGDLAINEVT
ncbi:MAG TPA: hypothetical protein VH419_00810, partial [Nocardioidaceae bacterium]